MIFLDSGEMDWLSNRSLDFRDSGRNRAITVFAEVRGGGSRARL